MFQSQEPTFSQQRKDDHVRLALGQQNQPKPSPFEGVRFVHHSFAPLSQDHIDISTTWAGHHHKLPFYINGMTGGSQATKRYNQLLASLAHECGLAMASGSVSGALSDPGVADSYTVIRQVNPHGFVMANLGAHHGLENAKRAVDLLDANALQIHLNVPQEIVMPEGDRDFRSWLDNIARIVDGLPVPVIVKEVGFGMSRETIKTLIDLGVTTIDVSGRGGTNFIQIENDRRQQLDYQAIAGWGQTTPESLLEASAYMDQVSILASGGITHYFDILKALAMGAKAVGLSGYFLKMVHQDGLDQAIQVVHHWQEALTDLMLMINSPSVQDLHHTDLILSPDLQAYATARGIDWLGFGQRSRNKSK